MAAAALHPHRALGVDLPTTHGLMVTDWQLGCLAGVVGIYCLGSLLVAAVLTMRNN